MIFPLPDPCTGVALLTKNYNIWFYLLKGGMKAGCFDVITSLLKSGNIGDAGLSLCKQKFGSKTLQLAFSGGGDFHSTVNKTTGFWSGFNIFARD